MYFESFYISLTTIRRKKNIIHSLASPVLSHQQTFLLALILAKTEHRAVELDGCACGALMGIFHWMIYFPFTLLFELACVKWNVETSNLLKEEIISKLKEKKRYWLIREEKIAVRYWRQENSSWLSMRNLFVGSEKTKQVQ